MIFRSRVKEFFLVILILVSRFVSPRNEVRKGIVDYGESNGDVFLFFYFKAICDNSIDLLQVWAVRGKYWRNFKFEKS